MSKNSAFLRTVFLGGAALGAMTLAAGSAWGQTPQQPTPRPTTTPAPDQTTPPPAAQEEAPDRVVITGSRIARDQFTSASPIVVITAETAALQGMVDTADILQNNPVANGSSQINGQFGAFVTDGGPGTRTVSLRGLGAQRSLVLLNGRRLGGAGTGGTTGAVDLNTIPDAIVQRYEILKDGASSIYGSDAVAGVVNVITRNSVTKPEINFSLSDPFDTGGSSFSLDGAYGLNFDNGSITMAAAWQHREPLRAADRAFTRCLEDYVFNQTTGERADIINIRPGDPEGFKCRNITQNDVQVLGSPVGGNGNNIVYVQAGPGEQNGLLPGLRPRLTTAGGNADIDLWHPGVLRQEILIGYDLYSAFATADFDVGFGNIYGELLMNRRESQVNGVSNIAPQVDQSNPFNPYPTVAGTSTVGAATAFIIRPTQRNQTVDYISAVAGLKGDLPFGNWTYDVYASYTRSDADYDVTVIDARKFESKNNPLSLTRTTINGAGQIICTYNNTSSCPVINFLSPRLLDGNYTPEEFDWLYDVDAGTTTYDQMLVSGTVTGDLFELPAGPVGLAVGFEYRDISLDDSPGPISQGGFSLNSSAAGHTVGSDKISEVYAEIEVPILRGIPMIEELTASISGRMFDYDTAGSDSVYKVGLNWQLTPSIRVRGTTGTSYRAPALYELFLANQTGFLAQTSVDPCINWGISTDPEIRTNCAAAGIPDNYGGGGSGVTVVTGGGLGVLTPETSEAKTLGVVFTPTFLDISIALDYFEITIDNEVARFGAASIASACYNAPNYPNGFCSLLTRPVNAANSQYAITEIRDSYININNQETTGLDLNVRYQHEFDFGDLVVEAAATWTFKEVVELFQSGGTFTTNDYNGSTGDPDFTGTLRFGLTRGDFTYNWFSNFIGHASNNELFGTDPLLNYTNNTNVAQLVRQKRETEATLTHDVSVRYRNDDWSLTVGIANLFDEEPPAVSTGFGFSRTGTVPITASQYDFLGRRYFINVSKSF
jgi:iron complex outermembrane receptor protein